MSDDSSSLPRRSDRRRGGRSLIAMDARVPSGAVARAGVAIGVVVAVLLLLVAVEVGFSWGRVHPGVRVEGVAVGGMFPGEARAALERGVAPRLGRPVTATYGTKVWSIPADRVDARVDATASIASAYAVGRTGGLVSEVGQRFGAWIGRTDLPAVVTSDAQKTEALVGGLADSVHVPPQNADVTVEGMSVRRTPAKVGRKLEAEHARLEILAAFPSEDHAVALHVDDEPVAVTDAGADQAYADARRMIAGDVTLTFEAQRWTLPAAKVAGCVDFRIVGVSRPATAEQSGSDAVGPPRTGETSGPAGGGSVLQAFFDPAKVTAAVSPLVSALGHPAVDARFEVSGGLVAIVPSVVGTGVDFAKLAGVMENTSKGKGPRTVALPMGQTQPKLTTAQAQSMGIRERVSTFSTDYSPGNKQRVNNIHTLAAALDGKMVAPGAVFSFNGAVGERTAAKGYQEAPAIVGNKLVPQLGGGICQIGTTFFNTVFFSGLPIVERTNHSFYISHYPKGRDATVSWGGPDFKFKNDTSSWILIKTSFDSGSVTISLYGTSAGYKVEYTTSAFTDVVPAKSITENDPTLPVGSQIQQSSGVDGRKVVVVRTVTKGGAVVRTDTFVSVYRPEDALVRVGTKPVAPVPAQPATKPAGG